MAVEKSLSGSVLKRDDEGGPPGASGSVGGGFDAVYALVSGFVLGHLEALLDRRAEARAARPNPRAAASKPVRSRRRAERA